VKASSPAAPGRGAHPLDTLVRFTNLAEISSTFLAPLKPETARIFARKAGAGPAFLFTAVLGRRFTEDRQLDAESVAAWKAGLLPLLREKLLGALILRFPWTFGFTPAHRTYLIQLRRAFHEFPLAAEFRHDSWLAEEARGVLIDSHIAFVNVDQPAYARSMPPTALLTSGLAVVRLHGRLAPTTSQRSDSDPPPYLYSQEELNEWLPRIQRLAKHASRTLVVASNSGPDYGLVNALQLGQLLGTAPALAPAPLIRRFPAEMAAFRAHRPVQTTFLREEPPSRAVA
jgi:uncharacterized protein YecE (DUF72 family)